MHTWHAHSSLPLSRLGLDETPWLTGRPAIPVLYLYSETVLPRPAYWPGKDRQREKFI